MSIVLPVSVVIATRNRTASLLRTLNSFFSQSAVPREFVIVDASENNLTVEGLQRISGCVVPPTVIRREHASVSGAAAQRNEGVSSAAEKYLLFCDDDVDLEPDCISRLWSAITSAQDFGGVSAMVTNQRYSSPGKVTRLVFRLLHGRTEETFAGKVLGPAVNLLPEDRDDLPEIVPTEWLNTTCTMYRRDALPTPVFDPYFTGYSLMEDLALSLRVAQRGWKLANARTARIFHDSQPGEQKSDPVARAEMELINRLYVMKNVLGRHSLEDYLKLILWECWGIVSSLGSQPIHHATASLQGKAKALAKVLRAGVS